MDIHIGVPQAMYLIMVLGSFFLNAATYVKKRDHLSLTVSSVAVTATMLLLYWGGFFTRR